MQSARQGQCWGIEALKYAQQDNACLHSAVASHEVRLLALRKMGILSSFSW